MSLFISCSLSNQNITNIKHSTGTLKQKWVSKRERPVGAHTSKGPRGARYWRLLVRVFPKRALAHLVDPFWTGPPNLARIPGLALGQETEEHRMGTMPRNVMQIVQSVLRTHGAHKGPTQRTKDSRVWRRRWYYYLGVPLVLFCVLCKYQWCAFFLPLHSV